MASMLKIFGWIGIVGGLVTVGVLWQTYTLKDATVHGAIRITLGAALLVAAWLVNRHRERAIQRNRQ